MKQGSQPGERMRKGEGRLRENLGGLEMESHFPCQPWFPAPEAGGLSLCFGRLHFKINLSLPELTRVGFFSL